MTRHITGRLAAALVACTAVAVLGVGAPAHATYPGQNGPILFGAFGGGQSELWSVAPAGDDLTQLTDNPDFDICPAVSGDGRKVAYCRGNGATYEIWVAGVDGSRARAVTQLSGRALFPDWNPRGNRIVFSWTPSAQAASLLMVVHPGSGKVSTLVNEPGYFLDYPAYSPDGRKVVYVRQVREPNGQGGMTTVEGQLWVVDVHTGQTRQLTFDARVKDQTPDWSPDGRRIAYGADRDIWIMDADGADQRNLTGSPEANEFGTSFAPDGKWLAFTGTGGPVPAGQRYVQVMRTDGSQREVLVATPGLSQAVPAWQPVRYHHRRHRW